LPVILKATLYNIFEFFHQKSGVEPLTKLRKLLHLFFVAKYRPKVNLLMYKPFDSRKRYFNELLLQ
jgi:hypothetical protein